MTLAQQSLSLDLYKDMLRIRLIEESIAGRYHEQKMRCPVHLSIGQEAIAVGVCSALLSSDFLMSNHRSHAHYLAKGGCLKALLAEIFGKSTGCSKGRGGSQHLVDLSVGMYGSTPIVGGSIPVAVGLALATYLKQEKNITVIFFGEGATEEGVFSESLNFAALKNLPILFVCENNFYSVYSPLNVRQSNRRNRALIAEANGVQAKTGFGNDVEEVYRMSLEAVTSIRARGGPIFLEFETYRHREHCGPDFDNDMGYRTEEEFIFWEKKCPLKLQAKRVENMEELGPPIQREIEEAFAFATQSPLPHFDLEKEREYV